MSSIIERPASEQLALLRSKKIGALELAEEHIQRIEALNPVLGAFIDFDPERVRRQARETVAGPLSGLCVSVESTVSVADHLCELGSELHRGEVARQHSEVVKRLSAAGAIILGLIIVWTVR